MDIIDIMLAKAMTPQGQTETYVSIANAAATKAEKAKTNAAEAVATVEAAASTIEETQEAANDLLATAQEALETAQQAQINTLDTDDVDAEIKKFTVSYSRVLNNSAEYYTNLHYQYPDGTGGVIPSIVALQKKTGTSETSGMTQKAITEALVAKADKTYVDSQIAAIPSGGNGSGASINMDPADAGHLVMVDDNGNLVASSTTDAAVIDALLSLGNYVAKDAVGLDVDYANRVNTRIQEAVGKSMGTDFDSYTMYGGRTKCNVADDGTINAFYGDNNYTEDGSNGQVMIYQPKFYYKRIIRGTEAATKGEIIRRASLIISATEQAGFKLAPIFEGGLEYVLLPAFDAGLVNDKLTSIAGVKPINNITRDQAEAYANARGEGWHIMNMAAESANQMLEIVEFGSMNGQASIEEGITYIPSGSNGEGMFITGSTSALGNGTGHATTTIMDVNGTQYPQTENGKRAIIYRGMENPWGNLWSMIGGVKVTGNGTKLGGDVLICKDFNYSGDNYGDIGFNLPNQYNWVNAMGYGGEEYDWVYLPIECSPNANSYAPVGDYLWTIANLNGTAILATGGSFGQKEDCGPFYYAADRTVATSARNNYGAKLLFVPTKNAIYTANIAKWNTYMGG